MDEKGPRTGRLVLKKLSKALLLFIGIAVVLPLLIGAVIGVSSAEILAMVTSTLLLQAAAPPVGMAMGLSPAVILVIMGCFAVGMVMAIFEICDGLSASSEKVRNWIDKVSKISDKHPVIKKYGAISCCFIAWIPGIGLYGTPVIAWVFKWKRLPSLIFTVSGFLIAAFFVLFFASKINEILLFASYTGIIIFAITGMLALGFSIPRKVLPGPLTDKKLVILVLVINFIVLPLVAYLLATSLSLPPGIAVGLIIMAAAAGVPFLPRIVQVGGDNYSIAGVIALFLTVLSVVYIPFILYALVPAGNLNLPVIILVLLLLLVVPLAGWPHGTVQEGTSRGKVRPLVIENILCRHYCQFRCSLLGLFRRITADNRHEGVVRGDNPSSPGFRYRLAVRRQSRDEKSPRIRNSTEKSCYCRGNRSSWVHGPFDTCYGNGNRGNRYDHADLISANRYARVRPRRLLNEDILIVWQVDRLCPPHLRDKPYSRVDIPTNSFLPVW